MSLGFCERSIRAWRFVARPCSAAIGERAVITKVVVGGLFVVDP